MRKDKPFPEQIPIRPVSDVDAGDIVELESCQPNATAVTSDRALKPPSSSPQNMETAYDSPFFRESSNIFLIHSNYYGLQLGSRLKSPPFH